MYHPTTRVLAVLEMLQSRQRIRGAELAERLEVDGRTVRRYIEILQDLGIPIEGERGRYGAYTLRPGFKLPPLMFSDEEAVAVVLGLLVARRLGVAGAAPAVEGALAKLERVLPVSLQEQIRAVQEMVVLDIPSGEPAPMTNVVVTLSTAARKGRQVWMQYRSARGETSTRAFDTYGLVYRKGRWYATGYCHLRQDLRLFRLDRVLAAEPQDETFMRPKDFDPLADVLRSLATGPGEPMEVLLETTLQHAQRVVPPEQALLEDTPDGVLFRCHVRDLRWMARLLASLGCPLVVHRPAELRDELRRHAMQIAHYASREIAMQKEV